MTRRKFLATVGLGLAGSGIYATAIEPQWLTLSRWTVPVKRGHTPPLKILHLSDLHASRVVSLDFIAAAVRKGLALGPDVICLTGDFITRGYDELDGYAEVLGRLARAAPTFACLGNHDGGAWAAQRRGYPTTHRVRELLARAGVTLLHNEATRLKVRGRPLTLIGLGDLWAGELQPALAFEGLTDEGATRLVLAHNPDARTALREYNWDLLLCGHTHGGQVKLPLFGPLLLPIRDRRFAEGLHPWEGRWIYVTRGVGNLHGIRFNCPPEIALLIVA
ncbi:MAG: phosphodiesterase YaeI [Verrucomicrobiales bacterium]|nr:phosphodiesterase YaeI [Verrucomicrobiales bacterium]